MDKMMKIAHINMLSEGSTGNIMFQLAEKGREAGIDVKTYSPVPFDINQRPKELRAIDGHMYWGSRLGSGIHCYLGIITGRNGCFSYIGTRQLIKELKAFNPDVIHLHNVHKFCINLRMLFRYIKEEKKRVIWTLHDCWSFTGKCPHFEFVGCDKWKTGCGDCPQLSTYPKSCTDATSAMYRKKKEWFTGVEDMTLVTPSSWLSSYVEKSFLKNYPTKVINNGVDTEIFKPTRSSFREEYNCQSRKIVLGVAFDWSDKKGLDVFCSLAKDLGDDYQIVLVGTTEAVDSILPGNVISIHKTQNQHQLAEIYSVADVFVNPTREEVFGLVNVEALACGTPVVTFNTGGCGEIVDDTCGIVVEIDDIQALAIAVKDICENKLYSLEVCREQAKRFDKEDKYKEYIDLYLRKNYEK